MNDQPPPQNPQPLDSGKITWAALLGHWVDFARSALALPDDLESWRLRESVPDLIMLQAVCFALEHLQKLDVAEQALGLDRAAILIRKHTDALRRRWEENSPPDRIIELLADAADHLQAAEAARPT